MDVDDTGLHGARCAQGGGLWSIETCETNLGNELNTLKV
jgi:hypothetical protein